MCCSFFDCCHYCRHHISDTSLLEVGAVVSPIHKCDFFFRHRKRQKYIVALSGKVATVKLEEYFLGMLYIIIYYYYIATYF